MLPMRTLKSLDVSCPVVGMGTWPLGGPLQVGAHALGRGTRDPGDEAVVAALAAGLTFFDTADLYGDGKAEEVLGKSIGAVNAPVVICTKVGNRIRGDSVVQDFSPAWIAEAVDRSLARLRRDSVDILLLHSPPAEFDWRSADFAVFERLRERGKINAYGVSCRSAVAAERALDAGFGTVLEVIYNVVDRRVQRLFRRASEAGRDIICRMPLAYGLLAGGGRLLGPGDHRSQMAPQERQWLFDMAERLSFLDELPGGRAVSALRFSISDPAVSVSIVGMHRKDHVDAAVQAATLGPLPSATVRRIESAVPTVYPGWT